MQASNCLRSTWWQDRRMRLPWSDEVPFLVPEPLRAEHVRLKLRSSTVQSDDASPTCILNVGMFCIDAIDEKGGQPFEQLDSVVAFSTAPGAGTEVAADGSNRRFRSTIASRDASYRHQVNLDRGGRKWKSNQVW
ncbi:unnamed protein product [Musa banksii]